MSSETPPVSPATSAPTSDVIIDMTPLLADATGTSNSSNNGSGDSNNWSSRRSGRLQSLREAARYLRRVSSRRLMREPSMLVREAAAEQIEERQSDWAYSKPVVILDVIWNLAFVAVAASVLVLSRHEDPNMPLRLWISGYALQCALHMVCVCVEYRRRRRRSVEFDPRTENDGNYSSSGSRGDSGEYDALGQLEEDGNSVAKHLESANTMFSFIWWVIGFYWVSAGGPAMAHDSPQLYWLCIVFLGFDVFFVVFCVALACVIGIAVCCCLPCIIAILYAVADQEGASKEVIEQLPKFKFQATGDHPKLSDDAQRPFGGIMSECGTDSPTEQVIPDEDAAISTVNVDPSGIDCLLWEDSSEPFSTAACYRTLERATFSVPDRLIPNVWRQHGAPKWQSFLWLACLEKVVSRGFLVRVGALPEEEGSCKMCGLWEEDSNHILLHCRIAWTCWSMLLLKWGISWAPPKTMADLFLQWEGLCTSSRLREIWYTMLFSLTWSIWLGRNNCIFNNEHSNAPDIFLKGLLHGFSWAKSNLKDAWPSGLMVLPTENLVTLL